MALLYNISLKQKICWNGGIFSENKGFFLIMKLFWLAKNFDTNSKDLDNFNDAKEVFRVLKNFSGAVRKGVEVEIIFEELFENQMMLCGELKNVLEGGKIFGDPIHSLGTGGFLENHRIYGEPRIFGVVKDIPGDLKNVLGS